MITVGSTTGFSAVTKSSASTTTYTAANGDLILVDATAAAFTVTLPASGPTNMQVTVKKTDTSTNIVTVLGATVAGVTATIDGDSSCTLVTAGAAAVFAYDGTNWRILSTAVINSGTDSLQALFVPTYRTGYWYDRRVGIPAGGTLSSSAPSANTVTYSQGNVNYVPIYLHRAVTIDQLGVITGGTAPTAGATIKFGLYGLTTAGAPGSLLIDWSANVMSPTAAQTGYSVAAAGTIPRGWSYLAMMLNATSVGALMCIPVNSNQSLPTTPSLGVTSLTYASWMLPGTLGYSEVATSLPATATPIPHVVGTATYEPDIWFRVVS